MRGGGAWAVLLALGLIGCVPGRTQVEPLGDEAFVLDGQIVFPRSEPTPTPAPNLATPTPQPTSAPGDGTYVPFAVQVVVTSDHPDLNVAPPPGKAAIYRDQTYVAAQVTMSNGYRNNQVTWESSRPDMVRVDAFGNVTATGSQAGWATITATSKDGKASGSVILQVTNHGDAELVVE